MRQQIQMPSACVFERELALHWQIEYLHDTTAATANVISFAGSNFHEIVLPTRIVKDSQEYACDIAHELCHAKLSEAIDPAFGCIFFRRTYGSLVGAARDKFARKAHALAPAWHIVDVWVNELRHEHWPGLTADDDRHLAEDVKGLLKSGGRKFFRRHEFMIAIGAHMAEVMRRKEDATREIIALLPRAVRNTIEQLARLGAEMSALSDDRERDLKELERAVQSAAKILDLYFTPRLIEEEGRMVWDVG